MFKEKENDLADKYERIIEYKVMKYQRNSYILELIYLTRKKKIKFRINILRRFIEFMSNE